MKNKAIFDVFFRVKPIMILLSLKNSNVEMYASTLSKKIDCTYSHVVKLLQQMEKADLVRFEKHGRLKILTLTKDGLEFASHVEQIINIL